MLDFEAVRGYISAALEHAGGTHTPDDVLGGIERGEFQLWRGDRSVVVTQLQDQPRRRDLCLFLAAGVLHELQAMLPPILEWGRQRGCTHAFLVGRHGWQRSFLARSGWKPTAVVMETDL